MRLIKDLHRRELAEATKETTKDVQGAMQATITKLEEKIAKLESDKYSELYAHN